MIKNPIRQIFIDYRSYRLTQQIFYYLSEYNSSGSTSRVLHILITVSNDASFRELTADRKNARIKQNRVPTNVSPGIDIKKNAFRNGKYGYVILLAVSQICSGSRNMNDILLSIIVPVYNVAPFLHDCLTSFFTQDADEHTYEVICVDDGSTDQSGAILDRCAAGHANMKVFHQKNAGVSAARNTGLDRAGGKYVWFVDSDDMIAANCLGAIKNRLEETNCDQLTVLPTEFGENDPVTCLTGFSPSQTSARVKDFLITRILKKELIDKAGLRFDLLVSYQEDNIFYTTLYPSISEKAAIADRIVYYYRVRANSLSRGGLPSEKVISSCIAGAADMKKLYETDGKEYNGYAYNLYRLITFAMCAIAELPDGRQKEFLKELKEKRLFPLRYSKQYTVRNETGSARWKTKIKRRIRRLSYTKVGFFLCRMLNRYKLRSNSQTNV